MSKKLFSLLSLLVVFATLLAACASPATPAPAEGAAPAQSGGKVTLRVLVHQNPPMVAFMEEFNKKFQEKYPNIVVDMSVVNANDLSTVSQTRLSANDIDVLDIFGFSNAAQPYMKQVDPPNWQQLIEAGLLMDLTGQDFLKYYDQAALQDAGSYNGKVYAVNLGRVSYSGIYYNRDLFKQYNLKVPTTWSELVTACETFKAAGIPCMTAGGKDGWPIFVGAYGLIGSIYPDQAALVEGLWTGKIKCFLEKNLIPPEAVQGLRLPALLQERGDTSLLTRDEEGNFHFNGDLRNARDVRRVLENLQAQPEISAVAQAEAPAILDLFERLFRHAEFTGRSGSFFAYEGLGSVYWHMVTKLLLAVQETTLRFSYHAAGTELRSFYYEIRAGLGYHKSPAEYGAFPTDPYSHTPRHAGARQPGMTGAVKEEILARYAETGIIFVNGKLAFNPFLLSTDELLDEARQVSYLDVTGEEQTLTVPAGALACFVCQTPILVQFGLRDEVTVCYADETTRILPGRALDVEQSRSIFARDGRIRQVRVTFASGGRKECLLL